MIELINNFYALPIYIRLPIALYFAAGISYLYYHKNKTRSGWDNLNLLEILLVHVLIGVSWPAIVYFRKSKGL